MRLKRWLPLLLTMVGAAAGIYVGLILALVGYALVIEPGPEASVGLIWIFCLVTVPASGIAIRALLFWVFRVRR